MKEAKASVEEEQRVLAHWAAATLLASGHSAVGRAACVHALARWRGVVRALAFADLYRTAPRTPGSLAERSSDY